jgi:hypothetical protein
LKTAYFLSALLLVLGVAACGSTATATPTVDAPGTFTAVALTIMPATEAATPIIESPTVTNTVFSSPTFPPIATLAVTTPVVAISPTQGCDDAKFSADLSIPDYSKLLPGTKFRKTWRIYNNGTCTWNKNYTLTYISGNKMGADTISLPKTVKPGEFLEISQDFTAPDVEEDYSNFWRLRNPIGIIFGDTVFCAIEVSKSAPTYTLTVTPLYTKTATKAPSSTSTLPVITNTVPVVPSDTPVPYTSTPVPSPTEPPATEPPTLEPTTLDATSSETPG